MCTWLGLTSGCQRNGAEAQESRLHALEVLAVRPWDGPATPQQSPTSYGYSRATWEVYICFLICEIWMLPRDTSWKCHKNQEVFTVCIALTSYHSLQNLHKSPIIPAEETTLATPVSWWQNMVKILQVVLRKHTSLLQRNWNIEGWPYLSVLYASVWLLRVSPHAFSPHLVYS